MTEEEKKAIVRAREHIIDPAGNYLSIEETETLLNIIDEQQNEIEDQHKELVDLTYSLTFDYISKDKIRDKIKKLEYTYQCEEEENGYNDETYMYYIPQIKVLKEMLGEL